MTESAPWWGVPVIAGGFLIIGGFLGFLFNFILEKMRRKQSELARRHEHGVARQDKWDEQVRSDVIALIEHMDQHMSAAVLARQSYHMELLDLHARGLEPSAFEQLKLEAKYHEIVDAHLTGLRTRSTSLAMSGSDDLKQAANELAAASTDVNITMENEPWQAWHRGVVAAGAHLSETATLILNSGIEVPGLTPDKSN